MPAGGGRDVQMNERAYEKFVSKTGDASGIEARETRDVGLLFWRVYLTQKECLEAVVWPEVWSKNSR